MHSLSHTEIPVERFAELSRFRHDLHACLTSRPDTLFDLCDAVLCTDRPVTSLVELSLEPVFRRGHGALYDALAQGSVNEDALRDLLAAHIPEKAPLIFGVDCSTYPRPDAECSPGRGHHYAPCRCDGDRKTVPGWSFQWLSGLEWGSSSWTHPMDALRVEPGDCHAQAAADQVRGLLTRLSDLGRINEQEPAPLVMFDQGYPASALSHALDGERVQVLVRISGDRVFFDGRPGPRKPGPGRNGVHGNRFELAASPQPRTPDEYLVVAKSHRYGRVEVRAWHGMHQKVQREGYFAEHFPGKFTRLPIIEGTVIEVRVEHLPDGRAPHRPMWLWHSGPQPPDLDVCWRGYLRRFDMEHTFRLIKSELGWTAPRLRSPEQAQRWTWLVIAAYTQLRLACWLAPDLRRPWEKRARPGRGLSPHRVRRGFRHLRERVGTPARLPKRTGPGPGRPRGSRSRPAPRHPIWTKKHKTGTGSVEAEEKKS